MMARGGTRGGHVRVAPAGLAGVACKRSVVDEAGHALSTQRIRVLVCIDREVRERVATDRMQHPARVAGDYLDVAIEEHPVARQWPVAIAERMPAMVCLRILEDRGDPE